MLFRTSTLVLSIGVLAVVLGATWLGLLLGRRMRERGQHWREPIGVLQAAVLGLVALVLAFGMTMAVGRYETRRVALVEEANAIGTTYLRAQTLPEPLRTRSLVLLERYTDAEIRLSSARPGSAQERRHVVDSAALQRELWSLAGESLRQAPVDSAPRLYVETLNQMIDAQTTRVAALGNRVPSSVLLVEVVGASAALALLALHLSMLGRGALPVVLAAVLVSMLLLVTFDLDRPTRGLITIPDTPLVELRASMDLPPAFGSGPPP